MDAMNAVIGTPTDDELDGVDDVGGEEVVDDGPVELEDFLSEPTDDEENDEGDEDSGEDTGEQVAAGGEIVVEPPRQREDGKWTHGKYVADTLEELVVQVEKGRLNAEKLVGQRKAAQEANPYAYPGFEDDAVGDEGDDEIDDVDYLAQALTQAMQAAGVAPVQQQVQQPMPGTDPMLAANAVGLAQQVLNVAHTAETNEALPTNENFDQAIELVIAQAGQHPETPATLRQLLDTWGAINPHKAALKEFQLQQRAQEEAQAAQIAAAEAELEREILQEETVQSAYAKAQQAFVSARPDWVYRSQQMDAYMRANPELLEGAKLRGERAVYAVFETAYQIAGAQLGAGVGHVASEPSGNMVNVNDPATLAAAHAARAASERDLGGMEVLGDPGLGITLTNPNPPGLAETPLADLLGIPTLND